MEAVAVGVCANLGPADNVTSTHRGHGHLLAKGGNPRRMFAELLGKASGYNRGKGGSMHIADFSLGILGANGIVGGGMGIATGAALSAKIQEQDRISVIFFGDGALNEGVFYEVANMARLWDLPIVYVLENNTYGEYTSSVRSTAGSAVARAEAMDIPACAVDGNDVLAVYEGAAWAVTRARAGEGPCFLECKSYRWRGHQLGVALTGLRPVVEIMFVDFTTLASDQIVNQAAKLRYMTGGQCTVPLVIRTAMGAGRRAAAQHSQSLQAWYCHIPGLKVVMPATPGDAKGLLKSAIRDDNPVLFLEDKMMYGQKGPIPGGDYVIPLGQACIHHEGGDATLICTSSMLQPALEAAAALAADGIHVEVIDPRTLAPLDDSTLIRSAIKTGHVLVINEGYQSSGVTAEIAARIMQGAFDYLDAPVQRLGAADVPVLFAPTLEDLAIPSAARIVEIVKAMRS